MSEIVERVGTALAKACMEQFGSTWSNDVKLRFARAAIEAMREPTEEMNWAGYRAKDAVFSAEALWNRDPANCWRAMIDEALK